MGLNDFWMNFHITKKHFFDFCSTESWTVELALPDNFKKQNCLIIWPLCLIWLNFDIKFGNRLYSKEKAFEYNLLPKLISNFYHYMDRAWVISEVQGKKLFLMIYLALDKVLAILGSWIGTCLGFFNSY